MILLFFVVLYVLSVTIPQPSHGWHDIQWNDPYSGNWTILNVFDHGITPSTTDIAVSLTDLFDEMESVPTIIFLPKGTYQMKSLLYVPSDVIIKGEGTDETIIEMTLEAGFHYRGNWNFSPVLLQSGVTEGSDVVEVPDGSIFTVGQFVSCVEDLEFYEDEWGRQTRGVMAEIKEINGNFITLTVPFERGMVGPDRNAEFETLPPVQNSGIENLQLKGLGDWGDSGVTFITFRRALNCFVKNIVSFNTGLHHVFVSESHKIIITDSTFEEATVKGGGGQGYGIICGFATYVRATNNILKDLRHQIGIQTGCSNSVFSYNYIVDILRDYCIETRDSNCRLSDWVYSKELNGIANGRQEVDVVIHGHMPHDNLFEGNRIYIGISDRVHEFNGPRNTFFRNYAQGQFYSWLWELSFTIFGKNDEHTIVGNFLENNSTILFDPDPDDRTAEDYCTVGLNMIKNEVDMGEFTDTEIEDSLYLTEKPDFWCNDLTFPPYGPSASTRENKIPAQIRYEGGVCITENSDDDDDNDDNDNSDDNNDEDEGFANKNNFLKLLALTILLILCKP